MLYHGGIAFTSWPFADGIVESGWFLLFLFCFLSVITIFVFFSSFEYCFSNKFKVIDCWINFPILTM